MKERNYKFGSKFYSKILVRLYKKIRRNLPREIDEWVGRIEIFRLNCWKKKYHSPIDSSQKKVKIVFLVGFLEVWNSVASIFEAARQCPNIEVHLVAMPRWISSTNLFDFDSDKIYNFCKSLQCEQVHRIHPKEFDVLEKIKPDFIFLSRPYEEEYYEGYKFKDLSRLAQVCYVPYGFNVITNDTQHVVLNDKLLGMVDYLFTANHFSYMYCRRQMKYINHDRVLYELGFPRFDLVRKEIAENSSCENRKITLLWLPRWKHTESTFMQYRDHFVEYVRKVGNIKLLFRPHPLMYQALVADRVVEEQELKKWIDSTKELTNFEHDGNSDYLPVFEQSDVLIADFSSLLVEYFITGKPVIYLGSMENLSDEASEIYRTFYRADSWDAIQDIIINLQKGIDEKKIIRDKVLNKYYGSQQSSVGEKIIEVLLENYQRGANI